MPLITREQVIQSNNFDIVKVDVSEWGEINPETGKPDEAWVFVREMSAREKDQFESSQLEIKKEQLQRNVKDLRARLAVIVCCDESRNPIFHPCDVEWLTNQNVRPLSRIANAAKKLNDISGEDEEELVKN